jgi:ATP-dependent helicase HrpB
VTRHLPVDDLLAEILASLERNPSLVIEAPPGAGKTTRVPAALLDAVPGEVLVLEPRRIAARMAARRVAWERGEEAGQTVGYQVRFERVAGPTTRLHFLTEGVLNRRLASDPTLKGVDAVVLDEFHERHLDSDLALALLKRLQLRRPELRLIVMSATLDAAPVARYLGGCPRVRSEGRLFDLAIQHLPYSPEPLEEQVKGALAQLLREGHSGDMLVFLPGAAEIRRALRACAPLARQAGLLALPLYGDLPPAEQDRAVAPAAQQKLILSTNVAESSVTIDGVTAVIDSGLARIATTSPWTGLPTLHVGRIGKASAQQRAGRAGRTAPGRVLRLYAEMDYRQRPDYDTPEILRADLAQLCLTLRAMNIADLDWLDAPPTAAMENADRLLDRLGATGEAARELLRYPLPPRLARMIVAALERGAGEAACAAAALLASGARWEHNDLLAALDAPLDDRARQLLRQLRNLAHSALRPAHAMPSRQRNSNTPCPILAAHSAARVGDPSTGSIALSDDALLYAVLAGFPDRVARLRAGKQVLLSAGGSAEIEGDPPNYPFMVALDIEDRAEKPLPQIRLTARIEPEWLIDCFSEHIREENTCVWNRQAERVDAVSRLLYDELIVQESFSAAPDPAAAAALLADKALEAGLERFVDPQELEHWLGRLEFAGFAAPDLHQALAELCLGLRTFAELKNTAKNFFPWLEQDLDAHRLRELAPLTLRLQAGRPAKVHYERGKSPWIASRLQDFFKMKETPRIGPERTPVVLHLLAPNHRAVQTTTDLAGFWERLYPQVRRELMRRYPRHPWPEDPHGK